MRGAWLFAAFALTVAHAQAQPLASARFPQAVRVGDLTGRAVVQPVEGKTLLGRVVRVVRTGDGVTKIVVAYGGWFGIGTRPIAIPADAMALLGDELDVLDLTPAQLSALPTFDGAGAATIPAGDTIRVALARPSH